MLAVTRCAALAPVLVPVLAMVLALASLAPRAQAGPLEDYLERADDSYGWRFVDESWGVLATYYFLRLQSQTWLDASIVDRPLWEHDIRIAQPRPLFCGATARESKTAILIISGGHNHPERPPDTKVPTGAGLIAHGFCRPVIELRQVPNEPLVFADEKLPRKEDQIIAYSFDRYLRGASGDWPVQLAMVRSVVQAMNALQAFSREREEIPDIEDFVVIGASKRGWTAWLTAASDPRVRAVVPVSIDMPGIPQQFQHHLHAYGDYAPALVDYKAFDIACRMADARGRELIGIVDPLAYRDRLTQPKLIVNSAGDQFFVSDSWRFYYDQLPGSKLLRYTVNTDHKHGGKPERVKLFMQVRNWVNDILDGREPPQLDWQRNEAGELIVRSNRTPASMMLWTADNPSARDFRLETLGPAWRGRELTPDLDGTYRVRLEAPARGWRAALVEATYGGAGTYSQQIYTTGVYVLPETLPYAQASPCKARVPDFAAAEAAPAAVPAAAAVPTRAGAPAAGSAAMSFETVDMSEREPPTAGSPPTPRR